MPKILVTGGAGFIGSHLVRELVKRKHKVRVLDNLMTGDVSNISDLDVEFVEGDVRNMKDVDRAMKNVDYVFHLAAVCINYSIRHPRKSIDINLVGSNNVFLSALRNKVKRLIFASSASVYGDPKKLPMKEDDRLNPITPYCISKVDSERLLRFYSSYGLKYNILRYFNVYGPGQRVDAYYTSVIMLFAKRLINNKSPIIRGDGSQTMDFVHVKDVVQANILAMKSKQHNDVFNVGTGIQTTIKELANIIVNALNSKVKPQCDGKKTLVQRRQADISKIKKIGYKVAVKPEQGIKEIVKCLK